jgi:predicted ribosome quality control (RQC) complex YloA/Tae2 family protein
MKIISRFINSIGIYINFIIGENAQENHDIIDNAEKNDIWFHISDNPSAHVISKIPENFDIKKNELKKIIKQGALICKEYSKYNKDKNVNIYYTKIKNVVKDEQPGAVTLTAIKKIMI